MGEDEEVSHNEDPDHGYSMKLGINTMNYMLCRNNDSFVVFHTISDLPLRTARV
jgi:hypothetical protein